MSFRIGITIGDGDGINIAALLECLAEVGRIAFRARCTSRSSIDYRFSLPTLAHPERDDRRRLVIALNHSLEARAKLSWVPIEIARRRRTIEDHVLRHASAHGSVRVWKEWFRRQKGQRPQNRGNGDDSSRLL
jgi:hypothetical protein